ncbi:MAG: DUF4384 domain-containing protein [Nitrospirae bacterium]|jgi:hypothetical protein|nr:DUF4384 domain-containing protein [Nitrospirota bacterium]
MLRKSFINLLAALFLSTLLIAGIAGAKEIKGAKAIFDSGEGPSVGMSVGHAKTKTSSAITEPKEKYTGISYQLLLLSDDGQFKVVPKTRAFKSGERIKMLIRTNRPGYMTIYNIGSSGRTNLLFNDYVEAFTLHEIPKNTNFLFTGTPGTETILVMLSDQQYPAGNQTTTASTPPSNTPPSYTPPSSTSTASNTELPPPPSIVASLEGAKSLRNKGAKDIVVEDSMQNTYAVISPKNGWKPVQGGMKDIVLESSAGSNYGVIPASTIADGGILTLQIKLKHN